MRWLPEAISETVEAAKEHRSLELGIPDASLLALAARLPTTRIATLDERHFRVVKPLTGERAGEVLFRAA